MNKAAQTLGRLGKGHKKTLTQAERKRRSERLAVARVARWRRHEPDIRTEGEGERIQSAGT